MAFGLVLAALVVTTVRLIQSRGEDLLAWAVGCLVASLLWGRF